LDAAVGTKRHTPALVAIAVIGEQPEFWIIDEDGVVIGGGTGAPVFASKHSRMR
jgi:hypothetical protein